MNLPYAGVLEGAIIGGCVGAAVALISVLFRKNKVCPECKQPLPIPWIKQVKECPKCGCPLNAKGEKIEDDRSPR
jgi:hypothetical protein